MKNNLLKTVLACALAAGLAAHGNVPTFPRSIPPGKHLPPPPQRGALRIRPAEAKHVKFVKYRDPSGYFTMNVPMGWRVKTGLKPDGKFDIISYAITVYDPKRPERELYFCLNNAIGLKSVEARNWYARSYGPGSYFAKMPVLTELSTAGFFAAMGPLFGYRQFTVLERLGRSALGGDVVVAECTTASGRRVQGLYHATVTSMSRPVQVNPFNARAGMVDVGPITEFSILSETAPKEEFIDWQPVLDKCFASIAFTAAFHQQRREAWARMMGTSKYIMQTADSIRGMIMDSYNRRNATYDVLSQKRSDATLGYERVQDTETGEYYRAENGFTDWYKGTRYRPAPEKAAYLTPVSGYINWK
ncbi:MAG: hypothetical protein IJ146_12715 [Kiritimatiellae bacterium]|nr:hypothetical protein [Kiritimatiellia bacterium]